MYDKTSRSYNTPKLLRTGSVQDVGRRLFLWRLTSLHHLVRLTLLVWIRKNLYFSKIFFLDNLNVDFHHLFDLVVVLSSIIYLSSISSHFLINYILKIKGILQIIKTLKWVNSILNIIRVNSPRLEGGLHFIFFFILENSYYCLSYQTR